MAEGKWFFLSEEDKRLIQWTIDFAKRQRAGQRMDSPPPNDDVHAAPIYIALAPAGGIPALIQAVGTGSSPDGSGDTPGSAVCQIYQIINGQCQLLPNSKSETVYNLSNTAVVGFTWVIAVKDRFGRWLAMPILTSIQGLPLVGKVTANVSQGGMGHIAVFTATTGIGTGTSSASDTGTISSSADLAHSGHYIDALFLLGAGVIYSWVICIPWQYGWLAVNMECNTTGTGT